MSAQSRNIVGVLAFVALIAGFWFLVLAPKRSELSVASDRIAQAQTRRDAAVAALGQAEAARAGYRGDYSTIARLGKAVPADDDVASLVYQLESIARSSKVDFRAVKLTGSAAAAPASAPSTSAPATGEDAKKKDDDSDAAATTAPAPVVAQPPPGAVVGSAGLLTVPFTFTFDGGYMEMQRFLKAINGLANGQKEKFTVRGRLLTVDGFSLQAGRDGFPTVKALVSATAYLVPPTVDVAAGATAQAPAGAATPPTTTAMINPDAQGAGR